MGWRVSGGVGEGLKRVGVVESDQMREGVWVHGRWDGEWLEAEDGRGFRERGGPGAKSLS